MNSEMKTSRRQFLVASALGACSLCATGGLSNAFAEDAPLNRNVTRRGDYLRSRQVFEKTGKGRAAFLGGSITEMNGYRPMVCEYLQKKFPNTEFDFVGAGISSTCSDTGAFRLQADILSKGNPDIFFVEFAVNDDGDGTFDLQHSIRGMEGIIRHIRLANPNVDIVMTFFVTEGFISMYRDGKEPTSIQAHKKVAERYGVSTINLAKEIQEEIDDGRITWKEFGGVHPAPRGNRVCADMIAGLLDAAWSEAAEAPNAGHKLPELIDPFSYYAASWRGFDGIATNVGAITDDTDPSEGGFRLYQPDWKQKKGSFRQNFGGRKLLCAEKAGAEASFEFTGNAASLYILAGPDTGIVECKIDDGEWKKINPFHVHSKWLHYPRSVMLCEGLENTKHRVILRMSEERDPNSNGNALRILEIGVNRPE